MKIKKKKISRSKETTLIQTKQDSIKSFEKWCSGQTKIQTKRKTNVPCVVKRDPKKILAQRKF